MIDFQLSVHDFAKYRKEEKNYILLDVREPWELKHAALSPCDNIPLRELPNKTNLLPRNKKIIIICHHGIRSLEACKFLIKNGFSDVFNIKGGIAAWSNLIDNTVKKY